MVLASADTQRSYDPIPNRGSLQVVGRYANLLGLRKKTKKRNMAIFFVFRFLLIYIGFECENNTGIGGLK